MFNSCLTTMEYRGSSPQYGSSPTSFQHQALLTPVFLALLCRTFRLHFVVTPALFLASNSYSLSRSLSWNLWTPRFGRGYSRLFSEIVLGIDNLVFIAILADKLPPKQRDKARLLGLSLALIMRSAAVADFMDGHADQTAIYRHGFLLLRTRPDYVVRGIFLLFKATTELHERAGKPRS